GGGFDGVSIQAAGTSGYLDPYDNPLYEDGNVGIILNPLGDPTSADPDKRPKLVAATRPIPYGYPVDLALSPDGKYLFVSYQGVRVVEDPPIFNPDGSEFYHGKYRTGGVFIFNVEAMLAQLEQQLKTPDGSLLVRKFPIDNFQDTFLDIDVNADYRIHD